MKNKIRRGIAVLLTAFLFTLTACGGPKGDDSVKPKNPSSSLPSVSSSEPAKEPVSAPAQDTSSSEAVSQPDIADQIPLGTEDTYWVAREWYSEEDPAAEPVEVDPDQWQLDLIVRPDGTARFRELHGDQYLMDDADLFLTWSQLEDGSYEFYNEISLVPTVEAFWKDDVFTIRYRGFCASMENLPMPQTPGELYSPAELVGTWVQVTGEIAGDNAQLESIVFKTHWDTEAEDWDGGMVVLKASKEVRESRGNLIWAFYDHDIEILDEPVNEGCANDVWSVAVDRLEDGSGYFLTMTGRDEMLLEERIYDEGNEIIVTHIYRRLPPQLTWWEIQPDEMCDTEWTCTEYTGDTAVWSPHGDGDFSLHLNSDGSCCLSWYDKELGDYRQDFGSWMVGQGGTIVLHGDGFTGPEDNIPSFWYGGVARGYCYETEEGYLETKELYLYDGEGVARLSFVGLG